MTDWISSAINFPAEYLKAAGIILGGAFLSLGTYVVARIKEARRPAAEIMQGPPRIALDPVDRDLGYTLVRTATDLTRALNDHADALVGLRPCDGGSAPPAPAHHRNRNRRPQS